MSPAEPRRPLVLVVDDEPSTVDLLVEILDDTYETASATDGEQALAFCAQRLPDLVLLDLGMPGVNSYEVCRRLRADPRTANVPIIFVTAHDRPADEIRGLETGAVDFITKPVHPAVVRARVRTHIALKQQADQLRGMALTDPLTGVANRRNFEERLDNKWRRCQRNKAPIALIMIDVDHFKFYIDAYGHQAGDNRLQHIAAALSNILRRPGDLLSRYGGEEFICLLPETGLDGAVARADEIGRVVEQLSIVHAHPAAGPVVTVSRGVSATLPDKETETADLVQVADAMLYQAKRGGRNCTVSCRLGQSN